MAQRKHVEDRQSVGEKAFQLAAVESDEDGTRERAFHHFPLQHVGLEVADCAFIDRSFALEPFGRTSSQFGQEIGRRNLAFRRLIGPQARFVHQTAEQAGFESAATRCEHQILEIRMDACLRVTVQRRMRIGEDQREVGTGLIDLGNARHHQIEKVQAGKFRRCKRRPQSLTPILHEGNGHPACVSLGDEPEHQFRLVRLLALECPGAKRLEDLFRCNRPLPAAGPLCWRCRLPLGWRAYARALIRIKEFSGRPDGGARVVTHLMTRR